MFDYIRIYGLAFYLLLGSNLSLAQIEICDNSIDDDLDGFIDLNDSDCVCDTVDLRSIIPNHSFEILDCCPDDKSQLFCARDWRRASGPTTDLVHQCGWSGWADFPVPLPIPDGLGVAGFRDGNNEPGLEPEPRWKEYLGACLYETIGTGDAHRIEFELGFVTGLQSPSIQVTLFGAKACSDLPFGGNGIDGGCPTNDPNWFEIGHVEVKNNGNGVWVKTGFDFIAEFDINAIALGPACAFSVNDVSTYYYVDNLVLDRSEDFSYKIREVDESCIGEYNLYAEAFAGFEYQWYQDGVAIPEAIGPNIYVENSGIYQLVIDDGATCRLDEYVYQKKIIQTFIDTVMCDGSSFQIGNDFYGDQGTYQETLTAQNGCDSIVYLNLWIADIQYDTAYTQIFEGDQFTYAGQSYGEEGTFEQRIMSDELDVCDTLKTFIISYLDLYIPNTFSPTADSSNQFFEILGDEIIISTAEFCVFDRLGNQVYCGQKWNGRQNGRMLENGVYVYLLTLHSDNGLLHKTGNITLLR